MYTWMVGDFPHGTPCFHLPFHLNRFKIWGFRYILTAYFCMNGNRQWNHFRMQSFLEKSTRRSAKTLLATCFSWPYCSALDSSYCLLIHSVRGSIHPDSVEKIHKRIKNASAVWCCTVCLENFFPPWIAFIGGPNVSSLKCLMIVMRFF